MLKRNHAATLCVAGAFTVWAHIFISQTSFIAIDGRRYFSLFDDAMISMRYAWNAAHGVGPVWNAGERVEGYTNTLMVAIMALAAMLDDKPLAVLMIQALGVVVLLLTAVITRLMAKRLIHEQSIQQQLVVPAAAFLGTLAYYPLAFWSLMGMETGLITLLLNASLLSGFAYTSNYRPMLLVATGLTLGLMYLTRNDTFIFAVLVWGLLHDMILYE